MTERMTADEARALLAGMTPGTLSVERAAGIRRLAVPQGDELALVIRDSPREFGGAMYSLEVCRGMDGPTREANAAAFAAVKRALATVAATAPDDTPAQAAGECDVAAIGARAAAARDCGDAGAVGSAESFAADVPALLAHIAAEPARVAAAVAGEREACAQLCEDRAAHLDAAQGEEEPDDADDEEMEGYGRFLEALHLTDAIRARGDAPAQGVG